MRPLRRAKRPRFERVLTGALLAQEATHGVRGIDYFRRPVWVHQSSVQTHVAIKVLASQSASWGEPQRRPLFIVSDHLASLSWSEGSQAKTEPTRNCWLSCCCPKFGLSCLGLSGAKPSQECWGLLPNFLVCSALVFWSGLHTFCHGYSGATLCQCGRCVSRFVRGDLVGKNFEGAALGNFHSMVVLPIICSIGCLGLSGAKPSQDC